MSQILNEEQFLKWMESTKNDHGFSSVTYYTQPSDLELRIRREVMDKISDLICLLDDCEERLDSEGIHGCPWAAARFDTAVDVQNLLKLLWGEDK